MPQAVLSKVVCLGHGSCRCATLRPSSVPPSAGLCGRAKGTRLRVTRGRREKRWPFDTAATSHRVRAQALVVACSLSLVAVGGGGCGSKTVTPDWHRVESPQAAPEFSLPQLDGGTVSLSGLKGHVVIMEFWATWCQPCRFSLPSLDLIYKQYRNKGVTVLLINQGESSDAVRTWVAGRFAAPILLDHELRVGQLYEVQGIPRLFIVDQQGRILYAHEGYGGGLERNLQLILDGLLRDTGRHG